MSKPLKILFLRSAHAGDAERGAPAPCEDLGKCADMWTLLFNAMLAKMGDARGLIARVGQPYTVRYNARLTEVRVPDLLALASWAPDIVIDRGGYREYVPVHAATPNASRVYIGCGRRWNPGSNRWSPWLSGVHYDRILVDSPAQAHVLGDEMSGGAGVVVFHKPAAETVFAPVETAKQYDLVFSCHRSARFKGPAWLVGRIPEGSRVLRVGPEDPWFALANQMGKFDVTFTGLIPRAHVPQWACQARVGVVCDDGTADSGPRVLPEFLAMNIPVIVRDTVRADLDYCVPGSAGLVVGEDPAEFAAAMKTIRRVAPAMAPRGVYDARMSINRVAEKLAGLIAGGIE